MKPVACQPNGGVAFISEKRKMNEKARSTSSEKKCMAGNLRSLDLKNSPKWQPACKQLCAYTQYANVRYYCTTGY